MDRSKPQPHHVVIVGGGFGGLYAAKAFKNAPVQVTLIDKRNFHLFQPLLYQVATGTVSPADISSPLRGILSRNSNVKVLLDEVTDVDPQNNRVILQDGSLSYDSLIVATGVSHHYFGNDQWQGVAPGLKTIEDALEMRARIFSAFEAAEKETDPLRRQAWMTFVIVGGGPTGVELAGAIAELAYHVLTDDFRTIDTTQAQIILVEGMDRVLPPYDHRLSAHAATALEGLGVTVRTGAMVTHIDQDKVTLKTGDGLQEIPSQTVLWAAGVKASALGQVLADRTGASLDRVGRVKVQPDLSLPNYDNIFVIGDLANFDHQGDGALPGVAPVAMQEGQYVARLLGKRLKNQPVHPFHYQDYGSLAVIGKNAAVVDLGYIKLTGILAWFVWVFAHVFYLIEFDNKLIVMFQWGWNYFTSSRGARLITGEVQRSRNNIGPRRSTDNPIMATKV
ncbi:NAD(P)/FAD-dependent oxidoreductase [Prochlorothrix hollandica]|uniref:NAD(P)/FAD-dependent oxidoreductase n=1 Tax=Prochlorothrix hollandica TaxID=1223 RepID=UPI000345FA3A|nr:NAD(P)/FAD-dependent oxidoreductase [Prochlorothrix hollandica]